MKKLLLILLCVPLIGMGQIFDFNDIKKVNSEKMSKKFAIENLYLNFYEDAYKAQYLYKFTFDAETKDFTSTPQSVFEWHKESSLIYLNFSLEYEDMDKTFKTIINQIKSECEYYDIFLDQSGYHQEIFVGKDEYVCYTCPNSIYKGKIGFRFNEYEGYISGTIRTFDF